MGNSHQKEETEEIIPSREVIQENRQILQREKLLRRPGSKIISKGVYSIDSPKKMTKLLKTNMKTLTYIDAICYLRKIREDKSVLPIINFLQSSKMLSNLSLVIQNSDDQRIKQLTRIFRIVRHLSTLKLNLQYSNTISDKSLVSLCSYLNKFQSLLNFSLILHTEHITPQGINKLFSSFCEKKKLKSLKLMLSDLKKFSDDDVKQIFFHLRKLKFLTQFHFNLDFGSKLSDQVCQALIESLKKFKSLSSLELIFYSKGGPSETTILNLYSQLKQLRTLEGLIFHLPARILYDDHLISGISSELRGFQKLKALDLYLNEGRKVTSSGVSALFTSFQSLKYLSSLTVRLNYFSFDSHGVATLSSCLKKLGSLRQLTLYFTQCERIEDDELVNLINAVKDYSQLSNLYWSFSNCGYIKNQTKCYFYEALKNVERKELHYYQS